MHMCPKDFAIDCIINTVLELAPFLFAKAIWRNDGSRQRAEFKTRVSGCQPVAQRAAALRRNAG